MKKQYSKSVIWICGFLFFTFILASCGTKKEVVTLELGQNNEDTVNTKSSQSQADKAETENNTAISITVYFANEAADGFDMQTIELDQLSPESILKLLSEKNMVSKDTVANSIEVVEEEDDTKLLLDLSKTYENFLVEQGTGKEAVLVGSLVNTFLMAYEADRITITIDGQLLNTGNFDYNNPLALYNKITQPQSLSYSIKDVVVDNEIQKVTYPEILCVEGKTPIPNLDQWNARIEEFAFGDFSADGMKSLVVTYEVATMTEELLSIVIRGECYYEKAAYPYRFIKTLNINAQTGESVRLSEYDDPDALMQTLWSGTGFTLISDTITKQDLAIYLEQSVAADFAIEMFDYDYDSGNPALLPAGYSYQKDGKTVLAMSVIHAMGDYLEIMFD